MKNNTLHLSRIDPDCGYDDFDPRDEPEPEEESDIEQIQAMPIINEVPTPRRKTA